MAAYGEISMAAVTWLRRDLIVDDGRGSKPLPLRSVLDYSEHVGRRSAAAPSAR
jgi:hypothetical protein